MLMTQKEKITAELMKLKMRSEEFTDYVELEMMGQYAQDVRVVQKKLAEIGEQVQWIRREEAVYKHAISEFPEFDETNASLELFYRLFLVVSKWERSQKRFETPSVAIVDSLQITKL